MNKQSFSYGLVVALFIPLLAIIPLLTHAGLPNTADGPIHLMRQVEFVQAWEQGNYYPRWGTDLALGHGMPIFSYAPPSLYFLTQFFYLLGLPLAEAMKAVVILGWLLYSVGMFLLVRRIWGDEAGLAAAMVNVYAPYRLREAFIQGNYGQFTGLACYALVMWSFHGLITDGRARYHLAAPLSLALLLFSHNISSMIFGPLFAAYLVFVLVLQAFRVKEVGWVEPRNPTILSNLLGFTAFNPTYSILLLPFGRTVVAGLLGLGLSAIFWLPAFGEKEEIKLEGITQGFFDFRENFINMSELFALPLPLDRTAINPEFPLSLGIIQAVCGVLVILVFARAVWLRRKNQTHVPTLQRGNISDGHSHAGAWEQENERLAGTFGKNPLAYTVFFTVGLAYYLYLTLPPSTWLWENIPLLELTEFPWRLLGPAIFCASVLAGAIFATVRQIVPARIPSGVLLLALFASLIAVNGYYLYPAQFIDWGTPTPADAFQYEVATGAIGTTSTGEFLPRTAQQHPKPETLWPDYAAGRPPTVIDPTTVPAEAIITTVAHQAEAEILAIDTPEPFQAILRVLYWPGWQLYLNGKAHPFTVTEPTGLIRTDIPAGQHTLTLQLESTPLRTTGWWLTMGSSGLLLLVVGLAMRGKRRGEWHLPPRQYGRMPFASTVLLHRGDLVLLTVGILLSYPLTRPFEPFYTVTSAPDEPQLADVVLQADFGDEIRLIGAEFEADDVIDQSQSHPAYEFVPYWRALREVETNYAVFLHLDAPNGQTFATADERNPENIPTRNWPMGLFLRNPLHLHLTEPIPPIRYQVNVGVYDPESGARLTLPNGDSHYQLGTVWVIDPPPTLPAQPLAQFGASIRLWDVQVNVTEQTVALIWQTDQPLSRADSIFVHLLDEDGTLISQADGVPHGGLYPLPNWQTDHPFTDLHQLEGLSATSQISIGIYDPATGQRLLAVDQDGNRLLNNALIIK